MKSKLLVILIVILGTVFGVLTGMIKVAFHPNGLVDDARGERMIADWLADKYGIEATAECPDDRPAKAGDTFTCEATTCDGTVIVLDVVQENDRGRVNILISGIVIDTQKQLAEIEAKLPGSAVITCPKRMLYLKQVGDTASCEVRDGDEHARLVIRYEDAETRSFSMKVTEAAL